MITEIENAIEQRVKQKWAVHGSGEKISNFDIGLDFEDILATPAISVSTERIGFRHIVDGSFELQPIVSIYAVFKNVGGAKGRRGGAYPLMLGTVGILCGQDLDLEIDPLMPAQQITEVFHYNLKKMGCVCFKIDFKTSFDIEQLDDEIEAQRLISLGMSYYLQEDDGTVDATDLITLPEGT